MYISQEADYKEMRHVKKESLWVPSAAYSRPSKSGNRVPVYHRIHIDIMSDQ